MPSALSLLHLESTKSIVSCEAQPPPTVDDYTPLQLRTVFERSLHARGKAAHELKVCMSCGNMTCRVMQLTVNLFRAIFLSFLFYFSAHIYYGVMFLRAVICNRFYFVIYRLFWFPHYIR